jgi:hypothetical protein
MKINIDLVVLVELLSNKEGSGWDLIGCNLEVFSALSSGLM